MTARDLFPDFHEKFRAGEVPADIKARSREAIIALLDEAIESGEPFYFGVAHTDRDEPQVSSVMGGINAKAAKWLIQNLLPEVMDSLIQEELNSVSDDEAY